MTTQQVIDEVCEVFGSYDWARYQAAGYDKHGDYCFIYSYPPVRTLKPLEQDALFVESPFGSLRETASLYIHIPYCTGICSYCYFAKVVDGKHAPVARSAYPRLLSAELSALVERSRLKPRVSSIHFGGGTPSLLEADELDQIMASVRSATTLLEGSEVTLECAPETIERDPEKLVAYKRLGVNRLNLGVESLDDRVLAIMGRRHDSASTLRALRQMQVAGYDNINVDLIYGLPGQTLESWVETLQTVIDAGVHSISTYRLRKHPMKRISAFDPQRYPSYEEGLKMQIAHELVMRKAGFIRASSHKYARSTDKLQAQVEHKRGVECNQLISIGCGAYGFINGTFYWNTKSLTEYGQAVADGRMPVWIGERLDKDQAMRKSLVMGMHTNRGISLAAFRDRYGEDPLTTFAGVVEPLVELGFIEIRDGYLGPTERGRFFSDELSVAFYAPRVRDELSLLGMKYGMFFEQDRYA